MTDSEFVDEMAARPCEGERRGEGPCTDRAEALACDPCRARSIKAERKPTLDPDLIQRLRDLLKDIEWVNGRCPYCRQSEDPGEHDDGCTLADELDITDGFHVGADDGEPND